MLQAAPDTHNRPRLISGWWFLVLVGVVLAAATVRLLIPVFNTVSRAPNNDPLYTAAAFNKDNCLVPPGLIVSGGVRKDGIPALTDPATVSGARVAGINEEMHGKFLVSGDRVIGVVINGEARAYPLSILTYHEVVNDNLGGVPIAVTYCPLCDSAAVFSRNIGGEVLEFGVSGELYNSNVLLYDRRSDGTTESLWSQLLLKAVSGPAADLQLMLDPVPATLEHWAKWYPAHPDTTVVSLDTGHVRQYGASPYGSYFGTGKPMFPVEPLADSRMLPWMARLAVVELDGVWQPFVYDRQDDFSTGGGPVTWEARGLSFTRSPYSHAMDPPTLTVEYPAGGQPDVIYTFWFAWYAMHPKGPEPLDATGPRS